MSRFRSSPFPCAVAAASVATLIAVSAVRAETCTKDAECPERFTCEVVGQTECTGKTCPEGEKCPDPEPCESSDIKQCQSPACTTDDECPTDMVCYAQTSTECMTAPRCKPNEPCVQPAMPSCKEVTTHSCVPRYVPPCKMASDCGEGFECVERMQCGCSGGGSVSADGGMTSAQDASCMCEPTGELDCELQQMACEKVADCPNGWSCEDDPNRAVCHSAGAGGASSSASGTAGAGTGSTDAGISSGCGDAGGAEKVCLPPYYAFARGGGAKGGSTSEQGVDGGATYAPDAGGPGGAGNATKHESSGCMVSTSPALSGAWPIALALLYRARRKRARA